MSARVPIRNYLTLTFDALPLPSIPCLKFHFSLDYTALASSAFGTAVSHRPVLLQMILDPPQPRSPPRTALILLS